MFHMTNDSHLFRTAEQLDSEGFYLVDGNRWRRDDELYLPLYEGKMVQLYDHPRRKRNRQLRKPESS